MRRAGLRDLRADDGFSLIAALLITLVVFILSTVSFALSAQNNSQSGRNRERVNAVAAAEAGLNYQFAKLQTGTFQLSASQSLGSFPQSTFTTTLHAPDGTLLTGPPTLVGGKALVLIRSVGNATGSGPPRAMEALVEIRRLAGGLLGQGAIRAEGDVLLDSNAAAGVRDLDGGYDADIYSNGSIHLKNNPSVAGSVLSQKCVRLEGNVVVSLDVIAKGGGCAGGPWNGETIWASSNEQILGNAVAVTGRIKLESNSRVKKDARSGGDFSPWPGAGNFNANHPHVDGDAYRFQSGLQPPAAWALPTFSYVASEWAAAGYANTTTTYASCNSARAAIGTSTSTKRVVRITSGCDSLLLKDEEGVSCVKIDAKCLHVLNGDLAIISYGRVFLDGNIEFTAPAQRTLHFIAGLASPQDTCFEMNSNAAVHDPISTLVYTPKIGTSTTRCRVFLNSSTKIAKGQVLGNRVEVNSNHVLNYVPVDTPGAPSSGFEEDIIYIREIRSS